MNHALSGVFEIKTYCGKQRTKLLILSETHQSVFGSQCRYYLASGGTALSPAFWEARAPVTFEFLIMFLDGSHSSCPPKGILFGVAG